MVGEIKIYGGATAPSCHVLCNGQSLDKTTYADLYAVIGDTFTNVPNASTFNVPNLIGKFPLGASSSHAIGDEGGAESITLTIAEIPSHSHNLLAYEGGVDEESPSQSLLTNSEIYSKQNPNTAMSANSITPTGGNQPHNNMPPYLVINYIIETGI